MTKVRRDSRTVNGALAVIMSQQRAPQDRDAAREKPFEQLGADRGDQVFVHRGKRFVGAIIHNLIVRLKFAR
jgi:hypothetical protein